MKSTMCITCKYFFCMFEGKAYCEAFNEAEKIKSIPEYFLDGTRKHNKPIKNQGNDLIFKEMK